MGDIPKWVKTKADYERWKRGEGPAGAPATATIQSKPAKVKRSAIRLDCQACKSPAMMAPTKIHRMSGVVVFIGYLIVIPSLIGVAIAAIMFFSVLSAGTEVASQAASDAEAAGAAIGATIGVGFSLFVGVASLIGGIIGWLLIMKKKVYKCAACGFILDRH